MRGFSNRTNSPAVTVARVVVTIALVAAVLWVVDLDAVGRVLASADVSLMAAAVVLGYVDRLVMIAKWYPLLRVQTRAVSFWRATKAYLASNFAGIFLPSLGPDVVRAVALGRQTGATAQVTASVVAERALGMVAMGLMNLVALGVALRSDIDLTIVVPWALTSMGIAVGILMAPGSPLIWRGVQRLAASPGLLGRVGGALAKLVEALRSYGDRRRMLTLLTLAAFVEQVIPIFVLIVVAWALDLPVTLTMLFVAIPLGQLAARLPISIWSLGVSEGAWIYLLGLFGVTPAEALSLSIGGRIVEICSYLPGAFFWMELTRGHQRIEVDTSG